MPIRSIAALATALLTLAGPIRAGAADVEAPGLRRPVEVIRDRWGIAHIYANDTRDLFFAQGFVAARSHMWAMELWRRSGEGKLAEVLGPEFLDRDRFARLLKYRGDWQVEVQKYHPQGAVIFQAFADGVNAAIRRALALDEVPKEFALSGFAPRPDWTVQSVLTRLPGFSISGDASAELARALGVKALGLPKAQEILLATEPQTPFVIPAGLDLNDIVPGIFDLSRGANSFDALFTKPPIEQRAAALPITTPERLIGSNAWVIGGQKSLTGKPLLANDPHRPVRNPALRYWVHLVAPGWNVIGATEPGWPGVSIGHNEYVAWGFTAMGADQQDLYVEELHPRDATRYSFKGRWREMRVYHERIDIKGAPSRTFDVKFTTHGPLVHEDDVTKRGYALRWTGFEPGGAGYIGSLAVLQSKNYREFSEGVARSWASSHAVHYADVDGTYGLLTTGFVPVRRNWDGMFPVPGKEGRYEWDGLHPIASLPRSINSERGFYATANNDVYASEFPEHKASLGRSWRYGPPFRYERISEVLTAPGKFSVADMTALQADVLAIPARRLVPLLTRLKSENTRVQQAIEALARWDFRVDADSIAATIYEYWLMRVKSLSYAAKIPVERRDQFRNHDIRNVLQWLESPDTDFGPDPLAGRDQLLLTALEQALTTLEQRLGADRSRWTWGTVHKAVLAHPLQGPEQWAAFAIPAIPRAGDGMTIKQTSDPSERTTDQLDGASILFVMDPSNWDNSVGLNTPGNESLVDSPHYADLAARWGRDEHFPLAFSRDRVLGVATDRSLLRP